MTSLMLHLKCFRMTLFAQEKVKVACASQGCFELLSCVLYLFTCLDEVDLALRFTMCACDAEMALLYLSCIFTDCEFYLTGKLNLFATRWVLLLPSSLLFFAHRIEGSRCCLEMRFRFGFYMLRESEPPGKSCR